MLKMELWASDITCLLVPCKSGVLWTNQVGGTLCAHPEIEGICVPLFAGEPDNDPLTDIYEKGFRPDLVARFLEATGLDGMFAVPESGEGIEVTAEAWVPVVVKPGEYNNVGRTLAGRLAILTYPNSD